MAALTRDERLVKTGPVGQEWGKNGNAERLRRVGKSEKVGFEARKKQIAGESALKMWEGVELVTAVEQRVSEANAHRFVGRELSDVVRPCLLSASDL